MEEAIKQITKKMLYEFPLFFQNIPKILGDSRRFFKTIENTETAFIKASIFAVFVSCFLVFLNVPSYKINGIYLDAAFYTLDIFVTWLIIVIIGAKFWVVTRVLLGEGGFFKTLSSFFYATSMLIFIKLAEIPTRVVRDKGLLVEPGSALSYENSAKIIFENKYTLASEW